MARVVFFALLLTSPAVAADLPASFHELHLTLDPEAKTLHARDEYSLSTALFSGDTVELVLDEGLRLNFAPDAMLDASLRSNDWAASLSRREENGETFSVISIAKPSGDSWPDTLHLHLTYQGTLRDAQDADPELADARPGIVLDGASRFYPQWRNSGSHPERVTFALRVTAPADWKIVSQGKRINETSAGRMKTTFWATDRAQEEIFIIADRFTEYHRRHNGIDLYAFLRTADQPLAEKYLGATASYLDFFSRLLDSYPYSKFALVENALPTGYGMPSFTLIGADVLRLPFILHSSYPHEILHNWWGNGVYVHPQSGNWCEGLTSYLADHLLAELDGRGAAYRFQEMTKYLNYVGANRDFPLTEFKARHDMTSQAVGYGKTLMMFHALRRELGDEIFLRSLREFFDTYRFHHAGFDELRSTFEKVSGRNLAAFFKQWTQRTGAPELELAEANAVQSGEGFDLTLRVRQKQNDSPFHLRLPVLVGFADGGFHAEILHFDQQEQTFTIRLQRAPASVSLDPHYDQFRKLDRREVPPGIGQTYGAEQAAILLPYSGGENPELPEAYRRFAELLMKDKNGWTLTGEDAAPDSTWWLLGADNRRAADLLPELERLGVSFGERSIAIDGKEFPRAGHSFVFTVRHPANPARSVTWLMAGDPSALPGLARKLPHYGKFGYMVFEGKTPDNRSKGVWPADRAGLRIELSVPPSGVREPPDLPPLADFKPGS